MLSKCRVPHFYKGGAKIDFFNINIRNTPVGSIDVQYSGGYAGIFYYHQILKSWTLGGDKNFR